MRKRRNSSHINYWESATDAIVGLLMIVLLCLLLVILSMQINSNRGYDSKVEGSEPFENAYEHEEENTESHNNDNTFDDYEHFPEQTAGGGGGGNDGEGEMPGQYEYKENGTSEETGKCAVLVRIVDEDTQKNIQQKDITFEIKNQNGDLVTLSTHYPKRINYSYYTTDEIGQFYLPEKIFTNTYYFDQTSEVVGYDRSTGVAVQVDGDHDWEDPLIVTIPLSPSKNTIRMHLTDEDGHPVTGTIGVYAKTDIATFDGTLRLKRGELADEIHLDARGYGESSELYLGDYDLIIHSLPEGYVVEELGEVTLAKRTGDKESAPQEITLPHTTVMLTLRDSYSGAYLTNAEFSLSNDKNSRTKKLTTNEQGVIIAQGLFKGTTYHLREVSTVDGYHTANEEFDFYVDDTGLIEGSPTYTIDATNYTLRSAVDVKDALLRKPAQNCIVEFYRDDQLIDRWNSGDTHILESLEPGTYTLNWAGKSTTIQIIDTEEVQKITLSVWSVADTIFTATGAGFICILLVTLLKNAMKKGGRT